MITQHVGCVHSVSIASDGRIATCGSDGFVYVWARSTGSLTAHTNFSGQALTWVRFAGDSGGLVVGGTDGLYYWNERDSSSRKILSKERDFQISSDGEYLAAYDVHDSADMPSVIGLVDRERKKSAVTAIELHANKLERLDNGGPLAPYGLYRGTNNAFRVALWDRQRGTEVSAFQWNHGNIGVQWGGLEERLGHQPSVQGYEIFLSADGSNAVIPFLRKDESGMFANFATPFAVWDCRRGQKKADLRVGEDSLSYDLIRLLIGKRLIVALLRLDQQGVAIFRVMTWEAERWLQPDVYFLGDTRVTDWALSPDEEQLALSTTERGVIVLKRENQPPVGVIRNHSGQALSQK